MYLLPPIWFLPQFFPFAPPFVPVLANAVFQPGIAGVMTSPYEILGVVPSATKDEVPLPPNSGQPRVPGLRSVLKPRCLTAPRPLLQVKAAYRKLCLQHHPDLCPPSQRAEAEQAFKSITDAYSRALAGAAEAPGFCHCPAAQLAPPALKRCD